MFDTPREVMVADVQEVEIASWSSNPSGVEPATEVHMLLSLTGVDCPLLLRFTDSEKLDQLVDLLRGHRAYTFGRRWDETPQEFLVEQSLVT